MTEQADRSIGTQNIALQIHSDPKRHSGICRKLKFSYQAVGMRILIAALIALALIQTAAWAVESGPAYDVGAVAKIHGGIVDCVGCNLKGADLTNTCVKAHDLHGANFDGANASLMCMSFANFSGATFRGTDLSAANLAGAKMDGADLTGAKLDITSFLGTDLSKTKGLTQAQIDVACSDDKTRLPPGLQIHVCH